MKSDHNILRTARKNKNLSMRDIAFEIGVSERAIWRWEHGDRPRKIYLKYIASAYGLELKTVYEWFNALKTNRGVA